MKSKLKALQRRQLILAIAACSIAAGLFYFGTPKPAGDSDVLAGVPYEAKNIDFKKNLYLSSDTMSIDDGEELPLPCSAEAVTFGFLPLDKDTSANLSCSEDYLGGVKLRFKAANGEFTTIDIGQRDADAGDLWDIRSLLTRAPNGRLIVETIVLSSSENEQDSKQSASCSVRQESVIWDPETKGFIPYNEPGEFFLSRFAAPVNVVNDCLDDHGNWQGQSK